MDVPKFKQLASPRPRVPVAAGFGKLLGVSLLVTLCLVTACSPQSVGRNAVAISDGDPEEESLAVGRVIFSRTGEKDPEDGSWILNGSCTAVLVGQRTVLTAAHCVLFDMLQFVLLNADSTVGIKHTASSWTAHPDFDSEFPWEYDIAVVRLESVPVEPQAVTPFKVLRQQPKPLRQVRLVGLGETSDGAEDSGTRRTAINYIDEVEDSYFTFSESGGGEGNACRGDSGGPVLASHDGEEVVIGLMSWVSTYNCALATTRNTRVNVFFDWIDEQAEGDLLWVDGEAPTVLIKSPANRAEVEAGAAVDVEVDAADNISVTELELAVDGAVVDSTSAASHVFQVFLDAGEHAIVVTARDEAGNETEASVTVEAGHPQQPDAGLADAGSDAGVSADAGDAGDAGGGEGESGGCGLASSNLADPSFEWLLCMLALWALFRRRR